MPKRTAETETATGTQALDRGVAILKHLGNVGQQGATIASIGDALGLKQQTAHRIVTALERHGLIDRERARPSAIGWDWRSSPWVRRPRTAPACGAWPGRR